MSFMYKCMKIKWLSVLSKARTVVQFANNLQVISVYVVMYGMFVIQGKMKTVKQKSCLSFFETPTNHPKCYSYTACAEMQRTILKPSNCHVLLFYRKSLVCALSLPKFSIGVKEKRKWNCLFRIAGLYGQLLYFDLVLVFLLSRVHVASDSDVRRGAKVLVLKRVCGDSCNAW